MKQDSMLTCRFEARRLKHLLVEPLKYGANEAALGDEADDPRFVRITDIAANGSLKPHTFRSLSPVVAQPYLLKHGDLLFARSGATVGKSIMYREDWGQCCFAGYLIRARLDSKQALPQYIRYFSESRLYWQYITSEQIQATIQNVSAERYGNLPIPLPNVVEQRTIVGFLDRETAKIDALIGKQEQLIATLREDRIATITHAVTKGLDPNVEMKDSGVEWLGEIPAHWKVSRFSRHVAINEGQVDPRLSEYSDMPLIAPNHIESRTGRLLAVETASEQGADSGKYYVNSGQIIYSKIRPNLAKVTVAPCDTLCSADMYGLEPDKSIVSPTFLFYEILSTPFTDYVVDSSMRVAMPKVNRESLGAAPLWIPTLQEQVDIAEFLQRRIASMDLLHAKSEQMIETLREYRSALITDAVTGKIDVRGAA